MQCVQFDPSSKKLQLINKKIPDIGPNEVLVEVHYAGICGTDLHILQGEFPCKEDGPLVLGHEFSGVVTKIGENIKHLKIGDKVVIDPNKGCRICSRCRNGNPHYCKDGGLNNTVGIYHDGGWQQFCAVAGDQVVNIPENITLRQASLTEPVSCVSHGWDLISPVPFGSRILIMGAGIIGNLFISLLHVRGYKKVSVSEPNTDRLNLIRNISTEFKFLHPSVIKERHLEDASYLFDVVIDCSGNTAALELGFSLLDCGGRLCIFGVAKPTAKISLSPYEIFKKELSLLGVTTNPFSFPKAFDYMEAMGDRYLNFGKLGIEVFKLEDYGTAIQKLKTGAIAKATFQMKH